MPHTFFLIIYKVVVDRSVFGAEKHFGGFLELGEVFVGVCVISNKSPVVFSTQGEVDHVFFGLRIIDGLRRPNPMGIAELFGKCFGEYDVAVGPVYEVGGLHQHDTGIGSPSVLVGEHVGGHHIECFSVVSAQDVWVAYASAAGDAVGGYDGAVVVEGFPVEAVFAYGKAQLLLQICVAPSFKVSEEVALCPACGGLECKGGRKECAGQDLFVHGCSFDKDRMKIGARFMRASNCLRHKYTDIC